ncbi:MAG TPA: hypothetical protein VL966_06485 [Alphaproteobacteria bacterium]|jgi:hypothetical protein|nr:hypothetical protein [Alphaproteobacteria bacterium]
MGGFTSIVFDPYLPMWATIALGALALIAVIAALFVGARGAIIRALALAALFGAITNPTLRDEEREPLPSVALVVKDDSPSQAVGDRRDQAEQARQQIVDSLKKLPGMDVREVTAHPNGTDAADGTHLFSAAHEALADVPPAQVAGVVMITDGQVHDTPKDASGLAWAGPLHVLLTGSRNERDRRLIVDRAPGYGIVGQDATFTVRVADQPEALTKGPVRVDVTVDGEPLKSQQATLGQPLSVTVPIRHGGANVVEIATDVVPGEITPINNRAAVVIEGVRDRLKVLLVSGLPHNGERVWRNLLKSDPSVDLVHFTILRPPEKQDGTPVRELSLIAFPTRELFEEKLDTFDLVIFDRYHRRGILPTAYLDNVVRYVKNGGAVLEAGGPGLASPNGLYNTPLKAVLPLVPTGQMIDAPFKPHVTDIGRRHPVTMGLPGEGNKGDEPSWSRWFRQADATAPEGQTVMEGAGGKPLLVLNRVGQGRVAELSSDQIWLWARGYEGGGPQAELLRRVAHWLMKEPSLEEEDLRAVAQGSNITVTRVSLSNDPVEVSVRTPSGQDRSMMLTPRDDSPAQATLAADEPGVWRFDDGQHKAVAVVGAELQKELADVRATDSVLGPIVKAKGGAVDWISDGVPEARLSRAGQTAAGRGWIGFAGGVDYVVKGVRELPLAPAFLALLVVLAALAGAWARESR